MIYIAEGGRIGTVRRGVFGGWENTLEIGFICGEIMIIQTNHLCRSFRVTDRDVGMAVEIFAFLVAVQGSARGGDGFAAVFFRV